MIKKKSEQDKPELPKLPFGQGSFKYQAGKDLISYRKRIDGTDITVYGKTTKECFSKMKIKEREVEKQNKLKHPTDTPVVALLQDGIERWLFTFKKPMMKGRSFDTIEGTFNNQIKDTYLGMTSIENVSSEDIQLYLNELINTHSESTTKKTFSLLKQFFEYYYARDLNNNPMNIVKMPKKQVIYTGNKIEDDDELVVLSDDEIDRLTMELLKPYTPGKIGYSYGHMLLFIMWTFMRVGEVIALQYKDIDFENNTLKIYKAYGKEKVRDDSGKAKKKYDWVLTTTKSKSGRRVLYMHDYAVEHLKEHLRINFPAATDDTFIFFSKQGNPMPDQFLNNMLTKALERAKITKHVSIHGLRHTGISYFIRHGVPNEVISKMAGHSGVAITNDVYYDVIEEQKKNAYSDMK